ncbi:efflux RND transporter permease subunit [Coralliovum pocilloporae]|uniref:efflux RND transporter permease subunit n=1 Tax=Coralliovum pocilloporae TaxID=3066369 RepID=UPI0033071A2F
MNGLTRFGINQSRFTILIMIGLIVQGLLLYTTFPKREDPAITIRTAVVQARFAGMGPERVEQLIAIPLERRIREIGEVDDINTLVTTGVATIYVAVKESIPSEDLDRIFQDLRNKMSDSTGDLPDGTSGPFVNTDYGDVTVASIAVTGEGFSYSELKDVAEDLQQELYTLEGLSKVSLYGEQEERVWLELDSRKLASIGVQLNQVVSDLQSQNVILPAGTLNADGNKILLEASGDLKSIEDVRLVLTKVDGVEGFVRLRDLLTVRRGYVDPIEKPVYYNGQPAIVVGVEMQDGQDIQSLGQKLKGLVQQFEQKQPIGFRFLFATFQADKVTTSVNGALSNVAQTFGVVLLVMLFFLGIKSGFIIAAIVPFTVMFALIGMSFLGIELEQVSIAAVIISLGLLVDNGLVIVEDIQGQIDRGVPPKDAAIASGDQFFVPLVVASITTVSAFLPMMILEGTSGEYAFSLGMVVALMLGGSWLTAMYILPALCVWLIKPSRKATQKAEGDGPVLAAYGAVIRRLLPAAPLVLVLCFAAAFGSISLFGSLKREMFPLSDRNQILIYMDMPKGTDIRATETSAKKISDWLRNREVNPETEDVLLYVADGGPRFYLALNPADSDSANAFFLVNTTDFEGAVALGQRAWTYLAQNHPEARFKVKRLAMGASESGIVDVEISGPDADRLLVLADQVEGFFSSVPGIEQNENDWGNKVIKIVVDVAQDRARELGISSETISQVMSAHFDGTEISVYREGENSIPIVLRAAEPFRNSLEDLTDMTFGVTGQTISLAQVATIEPTLEFSQIRRENQVRTIKISGKSPAYSAEDLLAQIQPGLDSLDLSGGYQIKIDGELETNADVNGKLAGGMPLALTIMFLAIMFQFNSFRRSVLIFMTIPLVLIGVPLGLLLTGMPFSFFGTLGLISLAGIIINNAIVLIDQVDIERRTHDLVDAIVSASQKRLRPILLTSVTTVLGLLPMALGGGALWEPMAVVMMGGLVIASVLSLFFVPAGYYLMFRWAR